MSYKHKTISTLLALALIGTALSGCDRHKSERAELDKQIAASENELAPVQAERAQVSKEVETLTAAVNQQAAALQQHVDARAKSQNDLAVFVQDHKLTVQVLKLTRAGVATVLDSKADQKTKDLIQAAGAIGNLVALAYCLKQGEECRNATTQIISLGSQIDAEERTIASLTPALEQKRAALLERQQKLTALDSVIAASTQERDGLIEKRDSLKCRFCF